MNKCPHCGEIVLMPAATAVVVSRVPVLLIRCPLCLILIGVVNDTS